MVRPVLALLAGATCTIVQLWLMYFHRTVGMPEYQGTHRRLMMIMRADTAVWRLLSGFLPGAHGLAA